MLDAVDLLPAFLADNWRAFGGASEGAPTATLRPRCGTSIQSDATDDGLAALLAALYRELVHRPAAEVRPYGLAYGGELSDTERRAWARLVGTLALPPKELAKRLASMAAERPSSGEGGVSDRDRLLRGLLSTARLRSIERRTWGHVRSDRAEVCLSDRPVVRLPCNSAQGRRQGDVLCLAVHPRQLFVAATDAETLGRFQKLPNGGAVGSYNEAVLSAAEAWAFGQAVKGTEGGPEGVPNILVSGVKGQSELDGNGVSPR